MCRLCTGVSGHRQNHGAQHSMQFTTHDTATTMSNSPIRRVGSSGVRNNSNNNSSVERRYFDAFGTMPPKSLYKSKRYSSILNSLEGTIGAKDGEREIRDHELTEFAISIGEFDDEDVHRASRHDPHVLSDEKLRTRCADDFVRFASERTAARNKINNAFVNITSVFGNELYEECPLNGTCTGSLTAMPPRAGTPRRSRGYIYDPQLTIEAKQSALQYVRCRTAFALASAVRLIQTFNVSEQRAICSHASKIISELESRKIANIICRGDFGDDVRTSVLAHADVKHLSIHDQVLSKHYDNINKDATYRRLFKVAEKLAKVKVDVEPQGLFDTQDNIHESFKLLQKLVTKAWRSLRKMVARMGLAGSLISILFIARILNLLKIQTNRWLLLAIMGTCTCANTLNMIEDVANTLVECYSEEVGRNGEDIYRASVKHVVDAGHTTELQRLYDDYVCDRRKKGLDYVTSEEFFKEMNCSAQGSTLRSSFAAALMLLIGRRVPLYSKIVNAQKFRSGVDDMLDGGIDAFEKVVNYVLKAFGSKKVLDLKRAQSEVKKRASVVERFCHDARGGGMKLDETAHQKYLMLYAECTEEITKWPRDSSEWRCASKSLEILVKLSTDYPAHFSEASARVEPIGLMMSGKPGIGKTYLLTHMAKIISYYEKPDEEFDMSRCTFQKPTGQYWEGYKGQPVLCMDDIFTKSPVAGEQESDAEMVVKLINQWPLSLNMANCALKGRFYMTSPYVLATTNLMRKDLLEKAVVDSNAIIRRFPLWYDVTLRDGKVCYPGCDLDETWSFKKKSFDQPDSNAVRDETFSEVMATLLRERRRRLKFFNATMGNNDYCKQFADTVRKQIELEPQGAALSVVSQVAQVGRKVCVGAGIASGCAFAGAKVALGVVRRGVRKDFDRIANRIVAISGKTMVYASAAVIALTLLIRLVKGLTKNNKVAPVKLEPQMRRDEIVELVQRNMFEIHVDGQFCGYGLGMDDMTMVVPNHFVTTARDRSAELVALHKTGYRVVLKKLLSSDQTTDQAFFRVKTQCKSLTNAHVSSAPGEKRILIVFPDRIVRAETTHEPVSCVYADHKNAPVRQRRLYSHTACLKMGECGAVVMGATGRYGRRVYGMHTAGTVDRDQKYAGRFSVFKSADCVSQGAEFFQGHKVVEILDYGVHNGGDSRLEKTPYHGVHGEVKTAPSAKRPVNGVDPMLKAISGYKREWGEVPPEIDACVDAVMAEIHTAIDGYNVAPVSYWEAAAGVQGEPYSKGLARGKSPGYPFILKYKDKKRMLGSEGDYVKGPAWDELEAAVRALEERYKKNERGAIFRDSLKDEPRSLEKVREANTRMISGCSVEMSVLGRTQTLRYTSALMQTRHDHGMMPGFNPFSLEAGQLYDRLAYMNSDQDVTAGDYKAFDKSQHPKIMRRIWSNVTNYLCARGCDRSVLEGLGKDTINARHLGGNSYVSDVIYEVDGTLPSGHWMTSLLNSMYNAVVLRYCWVKYAGIKAIFDFRKFVAAVYYGDDFLMAAADKHKGFNLTFLQSTVTDLGLTMTDEEGNHGGAPFKHITQVSFLCRNFRLDEQGYVWMPLQKDSMNDMYNWKKRSTTIEEHTEAIVRASLMEAAAHDYSTFCDYERIAKRLCKENDVRLFEIALGSAQAYSHWKVVHKAHVPVWTPEE